jgi:L-cysteine S-thiosulfotransferase
MTRTSSLLAAGGWLVACLFLTSCATPPTAAELDALTARVLQSSFRDQGIAKTDRLQQDLGQAACSSDKPPSEDLAKRVMDEARAGVKWPSGGQYFGDWKEGEKLAQSGRGMTWTDTSTAASANGGNCYNCHQISAQELSHGTLGPSLLRYGKNRGVNDLMAPTSRPIIEYTWTKLYNSKSYSACSNMPRFGHAGLLDEGQLRHLMSLLLDPRSPVNQ